jgi:hypothetical protein
MASWRWGARRLGVLLILAAVIAVAFYWFAFREASPGPGWIRVGSVADVQRQRVTKVDDSAYVVSYGGLPLYAFAWSYDEGIHEAVYYCPSQRMVLSTNHTQRTST